MSACEAREKNLADDDREVSYVQYRPEEPADRAVIILPPTGGTTFLESRYAATFCQGGFNVYVLKGWTGMSETSLELSIHDRLFARAQGAIELFVRETPERFIGLLGTSVGGLHVATALGRTERVSAGFLIAAGAPVSDVIAQTSQGTLKTLREKRMQEYGFRDEAAYAEALASEFSWEPFERTAEARRKPLGMVLVPGDKAVPTHLQERLRDAWRPDVEYRVRGFPVGAHMVGILQAWWSHDRNILAFFTGAADVEPK